MVHRGSGRVGGAVSTKLRFSREQRLTRASEIEFVRRTGKRFKTGLFDVRFTASPSLRAASEGVGAGEGAVVARVGVIIPKYKRSIVERNRLKRRVKELVRTRMLPTIQAQDVLIRALPQAYSTGYDGLIREMDGVTARIR